MVALCCSHLLGRLYDENNRPIDSSTTATHNLHAHDVNIDVAGDEVLLARVGWVSARCGQCSL